MKFTLLPVVVVAYASIVGAQSSETLSSSGLTTDVPASIDPTVTILVTAPCTTTASGLIRPAMVNGTISVGTASTIAVVSQTVLVSSVSIGSSDAASAPHLTAFVQGGTPSSTTARSGFTNMPVKPTTSPATFQGTASRSRHGVTGLMVALAGVVAWVL